MQIPNNSKSLNKVFKNVAIDDIILADTINNNSNGLFDDSNEKSFIFNNDILAKQVIDFDNISYNDIENNVREAIENGDINEKMFKLNE
jgi:hypothetical protein